MSTLSELDHKNKWINELQEEIAALKAELESAYKHWDGEASVRREDIKKLEEQLTRERERSEKLAAALKGIELNTRNASVVGHPGVTCRECEETNMACCEALLAAKRDEGDV